MHKRRDLERYYTRSVCLGNRVRSLKKIITVIAVSLPLLISSCSGVKNTQNSQELITIPQYITQNDCETPMLIIEPTKPITDDSTTVDAFEQEWMQSVDCENVCVDAVVTGRALASGVDSSFAILQDGSLWAWGNNREGQLGDGTTERRFAPVKIMDDVAAVSASGAHTIAIKTDGSLWAWGDNSTGEIGNGDIENRFVFVIVPEKVMECTVTACAGSGYTIAVRTDGSLWVWGDNSFGQLGDGTNQTRYSPVKIMSTSAILGSS